MNELGGGCASWKRVVKLWLQEVWIGRHGWNLNTRREKENKLNTGIIWLMTAYLTFFSSLLRSEGRNSPNQKWSLCRALLEWCRRIEKPGKRRTRELFNHLQLRLLFKRIMADPLPRNPFAIIPCTLIPFILILSTHKHLRICLEYIHKQSLCKSLW